VLQRSLLRQGNSSLGLAPLCKFHQQTTASCFARRLSHSGSLVKIILHPYQSRVKIPFRLYPSRISTSASILRVFHSHAATSNVGTSKDVLNSTFFNILNGLTINVNSTSINIDFILRNVQSIWSCYGLNGLKIVDLGYVLRRFGRPQEGLVASTYPHLRDPPFPRC
jgi:hypothetical protein